MSERQPPRATAAESDTPETPVKPGTKKKPPKANALTPEMIQTLLDRVQGNVYPAMLADLGNHLGVSADALRRLALGWLPIVEFKKGKNFSGWWTIAERDAHGVPVGLSLRSQSDLKVMYPGSGRGLIYEVNPDHELGGKGYDAGPDNWIRTMDAGVLCPICEKPDGCLVSREDPADPKAVVCIRVREGAEKPLKFGYLHIRKAAGKLATAASALAGDPAEDVVVIEGMSDTAAGLDLGFRAVGKPTNMGGLPELCVLLRGHKGRVYVVGENDKKDDGQWPGKEGMTATTIRLAKEGLDARSVMPPSNIKDLRAWKSKFGLTRDEFLTFAETYGEKPDPKTLNKIDPSVSYQLTDTGNMARLNKAYGEIVRYNYATESFYVFDGTRWVKDTSGRVEGFAQEVVLKIADEAARVESPDVRDAIEKHGKASQSAGRIAAAVTLIHPHVAIELDEFDTHHEFINCRTCTVNLRTSEPHSHRADEFHTQICRGTFDRAAKAPVFLKFLNQTFRSQPELIPFIQTFIGYSLTGLTNEQKFPFCYGDGENGKSTLFDAISYAMGDYAGLAAPDVLLANDYSKHPAGVAEFKGLRLAIASESRENVELASEVIKNLTGQATLKARKMGKDFFTFPVTHKVVLFSNNKPIVNDSSHGFWRRILVIPFVDQVEASERDGDLPNKLKLEADGILTWAIAGAKRWFEEGLQPPEAVISATQEYRAESDSIGTFLTEGCNMSPNAAVEAATLFNNYTLWCDETGSIPQSQTAVGRRMRKAGFDRDRDSRTGRIIWRGVALKPQRPIGIKP